MSSVVAAGPSIPTDAELLWRYARRRDDEAFARVVGRHMRAVRHVAFRFTHHRQAAEDVAQAAFLVMAQRPRQAMRSAKWKRSALPWLAKVCRYAAANWRRAEERRLRHESAVAARREPASYDPTAGTELAEAVRSALACLPRRDRRIVEWRHLSQMPWDEVARHAGTTPEAARKAGTRALGQLRVVLEKRGVTAGGAAVLAGLRGMAASSSASAAATPAVTMAGAPELAKGVLVMMMKIKAYASAASVVSLGAAGMIAINVAASEPEAPASWQTAPATNLTTDPAPFTIDLGKGGKLEVLWLAEHSPDGRAWHADGTLLAKRPRELPFYVERPGLIEVWLRHSAEGGSTFVGGTMSPLPEDAGVEEVLIWEQEIHRQLPQPVLGKPVDEQQRRFADARRELREAGFQYIVVDPREGADELGLDLRAPVGDWQVLQRWGMVGVDGSIRERADYVAGGEVGERRSVDGWTSVHTRWFARGLAGWELKVQLVTRAGETRDVGTGETSENMIDGGRVKAGEVEVAGVALRDVGHFQIVGRPQTLVRVRGLAAAPGRAAAPSARIGPAPKLPWEHDETD